jgi:hypothetical protein
MADEQAKKESEVKATGVVNMSMIRAEYKNVTKPSIPIKVTPPNQKSNGTKKK